MDASIGKLLLVLIGLCTISLILSIISLVKVSKKDDSYGKIIKEVKTFFVKKGIVYPKEPTNIEEVVAPIESFF